MAQSGGCTCRQCISFLFGLGLSALFLWISLRTSNPTCSIQDFYVPALDKTANSTRNTTLYFDVKLDNGNKLKGIYYDALNLTFYYIPNRTIPIGEFTVPGFYQGHGKKTRRKNIVPTHGLPWKTAIEAVSKGKAVFRVALVTAVRFKIMTSKTKRHKVMVGANVTVNDQGKKVIEKGIKLKSGAQEHGCYRARVVAWGIFSVLILLNLT